MTIGFFVAMFAFAAIAFIVSAFKEKWALSTVFAFALPLIAVGCVSTDEYKENQKAKNAQEEIDKTPRVVREVDGCKVYAFKSGSHWHYFTRCPGSTTKTDTTIEYREGKVNKTRIESIEVAE